MKITDFDVYLFDLAADIRRPKPMDNWLKYHSNTRRMIAKFYRTHTSLRIEDISNLLGCKNGKNILISFDRFISDMEYNKFEEQLLSLFESYKNTNYDN